MSKMKLHLNSKKKGLSLSCGFGLDRFPLSTCLEQFDHFLFSHKFPIRKLVHDKMLHVLILSTPFINEFFKRLLDISHTQITQPKVEFLICKNIHVQLH